MDVIIVSEARAGLLEEHDITPEQSSASIELTRLRDLDLRSGTPGKGFMAAASGLVRAGSTLYVVADDELHLACFELEGQKPGELLRLFPGELPDGKKKRKRVKPDLEILVKLPAAAAAPQGSLLALGSGSGPLRRRGALVELDAEYRPRSPRVVDASNLFASLSKEVDDLNLEGAWVADNSLYCLQRGNRANTANVVIRLDLDDVLQSLLDGAPGPAPLALQPMSLGECRGVPLSFSDASGLSGGRWVFAAVAEDTDSSYEDGGFVGAVIGLADAALRPIWIRPVHPALKIEGVDAREEASRLQLLLVTDADDPATPAGLYSATVT
jgi:hypothetical protein